MNQKSYFKNVIILLTMVVFSLIGCSQPLSLVEADLGNETSYRSTQGSHPEWVPGTDDPSIGDKYVYLGHLFYAKRDPGKWENPEIDGNWFWDDLGLYQSGGTPTPTATITPTVTPTTDVTPTPTPGFIPVNPLPPNGFPENVFAPYIDLSKNGMDRMIDVYNETGQKYFMASFIVDNNGNAAWLRYDENNSEPNGDGSFDSEFANVTIMNEINAIRAVGGDVAISFGGLEGGELASSTTHTTSTTIQAQYQKVVDKYKITWIDLNIEITSHLINNNLRVQALKDLQTANPGLRISFQVPAAPDAGMHHVLGYPVIEQAKNAGIDIYSVGIMTMNYGPYFNYDTMGNYAIQAVEKTRVQLTNIGLGNAKIGVCPMVGQNGAVENVFTRNCAAVLKDFVDSCSTINWLSMWSIHRDVQGDVGIVPPSPDSSGIIQPKWFFTNKFKTYQGAIATPTPIYTPTPTPTPGGTPLWAAGESYTTGDFVLFNGSTYQCAISHSPSIESWSPANSNTLWTLQ